MKSSIIFIISALFSCKAAQQLKIYSFPAEWEPHEAVWIGWSRDSNVQELHIEMIKAIKENVGITILSRSDSLLRNAFEKLYTAGIDTIGIKGYVHHIPNLFIRDAGPIFLKSNDDKLAIADFAWNNYGYPKELAVLQYSDKRGDINNSLAKQMKLPMVSTPIVAEGGALDVSSNMMLCFKETALQRNPGKTLSEIEKEYLRMYGKKKMIWLNRMPVMDKVVAGAKAGNYFGYGANGHIDEFVRFVNDSTILVSVIDPAEKDADALLKVDYPIMQENLALLKAAKNINGQLFNIIELPTPSYALNSEVTVLTDSMKETGDGNFFFTNFNAGDSIRWLPAISYANFFITNGTVLLAKYWKPGMPEKEKAKDEKALKTLQRCFPSRKIVQLNPMALNVYGGGMHCATQQQPKKRK